MTTLTVVQVEVILTHMKKSNRGLPSSESKKVAFENAVTNCTSRVDADTLRFLKYGAQLERAIISAG
jgi:hypothetical protein